MTAGANSDGERNAGARDGDSRARAELIEATGLALASPPAGVVLIELFIETDESSQTPDADVVGMVLNERIAELTGERDRLLAVGRHGLAVIKSSMTAPAEAEGFAYRVQSALTAPVIVGDGRATCQAAIGVAVSRADDAPVDLVRYAEHALADARMLGGDMVVAFEDQDRDLLLP